MSKKTRKETSWIDRLKSALREDRLESEKNTGRRVSKSWDSRPDAKKQRHKENQKLRRIRTIEDCDGDNGL